MALALQGCATSSGDATRRSVLDNTILACGLTIGAGAAVGYLAAGRDNRTDGAVAGAGLGLAACAVIAVINNRRDRERLALVESQAAASGQVVRNHYVEVDGVRRDFVVTPGAPV
jgi:hypothetical protein